MRSSSPDKPNILFIIADSSRTGAPNQVLAILKGLKEHYEVSLACPAGWLSQEAEKLKIKVHALPSGRFKSISALKNIFQKVQPQLIHCHGIRGGFLTHFALKKNLMRKEPVLIYTEHTWVLDYPMQSQLRRYLHFFLMKKLFKKATRVIAVSKAVEAFLLQCRLTSSDKLQVIYGGIEMGKEIDPTEKPVIGAMCTLARVKGIHLLLKAVAQLRPHYPDLRCKIGGKGKDVFYFQSLAHSLKIDHMVDWVGEVQDHNDFFEQIRIFVQPSLGEAFGLSALEAMASGIPVIVSRTGGLVEIVEDSENGLTFRRGDASILASQLELLLNDKALFERLSQKGRERAAFFTIEKTIQEYQELYDHYL